MIPNYQTRSTSVLLCLATCAGIHALAAADENKTAHNPQAEATVPDDVNSVVIPEPPFREIVGDPFQFDFEHDWSDAPAGPSDAAARAEDGFDQAGDQWKDFQPTELPTQEGDLIYGGFHAVAPVAALGSPSTLAAPPRWTWKLALAATVFLGGALLMLASYCSICIKQRDARTRSLAA